MGKSDIAETVFIARQLLEVLLESGGIASVHRASQTRSDGPTTEFSDRLLEANGHSLLCPSSQAMDSGSS